MLFRSTPRKMKLRSTSSSRITRFLGRSSFAPNSAERLRLWPQLPAVAVFLQRRAVYLSIRVPSHPIRSARSHRFGSDSSPAGIATYLTFFAARRAESSSSDHMRPTFVQLAEADPTPHGIIGGYGSRAVWAGSWINLNEPGSES